MANGKICQNIPGIEEKMNELSIKTQKFMEVKPFLGDDGSSIMLVEKECKGLAYSSIKDNDEKTYEVLKNWCSLSDKLIEFLQTDIETFLKADSAN